MLSCYYALYVMGKKKSIENIISLLNSKDYHIRCAVINILRGFLTSDNRQLIKKITGNINEKRRYNCCKGKRVESN